MAMTKFNGKLVLVEPEWPRDISFRVEVADDEEKFKILSSLATPQPIRDRIFEDEQFVLSLSEAQVRILLFYQLITDKAKKMLLRHSSELVRQLMA